MDEFFLLDSKQNRSNVLTVIKMDKIYNYDEFKQFVQSVVLKLPRAQHRVVKFLGNYFFQRIPRQKLSLDKHFTRVDGVHSNDQISDLVAQEQCIRESLGGLQYKFIFIPDYGAEESVIVFKQHHSLCDGIATFVLVSLLNDEGYQKHNFPRLTPRMSLLQKVLFEIVKVVTMPYSIFLVWNTIFRPDEVNNISPGGRLSGTRKVVFSSKLDVEAVQAKAKTLNLSLNDWILACVTLAMSQICSPNTNQVQVSMPFTLRDFPENAAQLQQGNYLACLPILIRFPEKRDFSAFPKLCQDMRQTRLSSKSKYLALGFYYMMNYFMAVLRWPLNFHPLSCADNYTTVLATVPGPRKPLVFRGLSVRELFYFVPGSGRLACGISTITHGTNLQLSVNCDTSYLQNGLEKELVVRFESIFVQSLI